jgi:hypothetical protein
MMWRDVLFILHVPHTLLKEDNIVFVLHPVIDSLASPGRLNQLNLVLFSRVMQKTVLPDFHQLGQSTDGKICSTNVDKS